MNKVLFVIFATIFTSNIALADMIAISCGLHPEKENAKSLAGMGSDGLTPRTMEYVGMDYRGKKVSKNATITTIQNERGMPVRYIIKDGKFTFVFSHLEKCGDGMDKPEDYARFTATKEVSPGKKKVVDQFRCTCDIDQKFCCKVLIEGEFV